MGVLFDRFDRKMWVSYLISTGNTVVVRCGLGIHQTITWLGHGFFLERKATTIVIGNVQDKAQIIGLNLWVSYLNPLRILFEPATHTRLRNY